MSVAPELEHGMAVGATTSVRAASRGGLWRRLLRNPASAIGLVLTAVILLLAVATPVLGLQDSLALSPKDRLLAPSSAHWFGTDDGGRDVLSRVLHAARKSLAASGVVLVIAVTVGTAVGLVAGYFGGLIDEALMRLTDIFLAFPALLLAMGVSAALGPSLGNSMVVISIVWWPWYARLVRALTLRLRHEL